MATQPHSLPPTITVTLPGETSPRALTRSDLRKELARKAISDYGLELAQTLGGAFHLWTPPPAGCEQCGGLGWYSLKIDDLDDEHFGKMYPCACAGPARAARLQHVSGLTISERLITLDDVEPTGGMTNLILDVARAFVLKPNKIVTLWGGSGNAKTMILQGIVNECLARGSGAVYAEMKDLADAVREHYADQEHSGAAALVRRIKQIPVLAIDEFDKLKITDWYAEFETAILRRRYRDALDGLSGTVIALNADPAGLPAHVYSRLADGRNLILHNTDPDLRSYLSNADVPVETPA